METIAPAFPNDLAERWGIEAWTLIADTPTSHVYRVRRSDGVSAIAKLLKPAGRHELPGFHFLGWRDGAGAVKLVDRREMAGLMEDAGSTTLGEYRRHNGEAEANAIIIGIVRGLHSANVEAPPPKLVPLRRQFRALFEQAAKPDGSELSHLLRICAAVADALIDTQTDIRPLHGDLHHENIITGGKRGWLAIDPQGLIGDPAYEVANIFGNPRGIVLADPDLITARVRTFAPAIGCHEEKILRFAIAHAGLSVSWSIEDGEALAEGSHVRKRIDFLGMATGLLEAGIFRAT